MTQTPKLLPVRLYGDVMLRVTLQPVHKVDDKLRLFIRDLIHTMYERDGVGLAANQVGHNHRIFVIDPDWGKEESERNPIVMINPVIVSAEGEFELEEGCISLPGSFAKVKRPEHIKITYMDLDGQEHTEEAEGYRAVVIQHENDHLNGILFVDKLSKLSLLKVKRKLKQIMSTAANGTNIREEVILPEHKQIG